MKLKIRKVETTKDEFFEALELVLSTHEKIPQNIYLGTGLEFACKNLGIKPLDFWKFKFEYEEEFEKQFLIRQAGFDNNVFFLWRKKTYLLQNKE